MVALNPLVFVGQAAPVESSLSTAPASQAATPAPAAIIQSALVPVASSRSGAIKWKQEGMNVIVGIRSRKQKIFSTPIAHDLST
jgi:hypothetical protein